MKYLTMLALAIIFCLCSIFTALALSDKEYHKYMQESNAFSESDKQLNAIWKQIKVKLSPDQYAAVLREQQLWNRNRDIEAMKTMNEIRGISMAERHAKVTEKRVQELRNLLETNKATYNSLNSRQSQIQEGNLTTFVGKVLWSVAHGESNERIWFYSFEEIPESKYRNVTFDDTYDDKGKMKVTEAFYNCLESNKNTNKLVTITAKIKSIETKNMGGTLNPQPDTTLINLTFDKSATCKRR